MARKKSKTATKNTKTDTIAVTVKKSLVLAPEAEPTKEVVDERVRAWQEAVLNGLTNAGLHEEARMDSIEISEHVRNTWRDDVMEGLTTDGMKAWLATP